MLVVASLLAVTGYGLYYIVDDQWRSWTSTLHWIVGLLATALLTLHAVLGKQAARARLYREHHDSRMRHPGAHPGHRPPL